MAGRRVKVNTTEGTQWIKYNHANWIVQRQHAEKSSFKKGRKIKNWETLFMASEVEDHYHRSIAATEKILLIDHHHSINFSWTQLVALGLALQLEKRCCVHVIILDASALGLLLPNISTDNFTNTIKLSLFKANSS